MAEITALFWDVGGVLLTNGWDRASRDRAIEEFHLDGEEFEARHAGVIAAFELGRLRLDDYLDRTIFYRARDFTQDAFKAFMFAQSRAYPETLAIVARLARMGKYLLSTLNNESLDLNLFRINRFGLRNYFTVFCSSCFLGARKPDAGIYRLALQITQRRPEESLFIDDRGLNLEGAQAQGMRTLLHRNPADLQEGLRRMGIGVRRVWSEAAED